MPFYEKGDVRIRYEETGSGFPLLVTPGGGLNSRISNWPSAVINAMEAFKDDFHCITMDQRNANGGESSGADLSRGNPSGVIPSTQSSSTKSAYQKHYNQEIVSGPLDDLVTLLQQNGEF